MNGGEVYVKIYVLKRKKYYTSTILFNILSIILTIIAYNSDILGWKDVRLETMLFHFFKESFLNSIDLIFIIPVAIISVIALIQKIKESKDTEIVIPSSKVFHIFSLTVVMILYSIITYLYLTKIGSGSLIGFIIIFANMVMFNYIYVIRFHE